MCGPLNICYNVMCGPLNIVICYVWSIKYVICYVVKYVWSIIYVWSIKLFVICYMCGPLNICYIMLNMCYMLCVVH